MAEPSSTRPPTSSPDHKMSDQSTQPVTAQWQIPPLLSRLLTIPLQALAMYILTMTIQYLNSSIGAANEAVYSRRARSKLEPVRWMKVGLGSVLVSAWMAVLGILLFVGWKELRAKKEIKSVSAGESEDGG